MSQHDMNIANQGFPAFRADLNNALGALVSNSSGATAPSTTFAHQLWVDTAANPSVLKIRNADNDAWITIGAIDQTGDTFILRPAAGSASVPAYSTSGDTNTGIFFPTADTIGLTVGGVEAARLVSGLFSVPANSTAASAVRLYEDTDNGTNYVDLIAPASVASNRTLTMPDASGTIDRLNRAGNVLQVVQTVKTSFFSLATEDAWTDVTGVSVAITPSSASNKILLFVSGEYSGNSNDGFAYLRILRDSTSIAIGDSRGSSNRVTMSAALRNGGGNSSNITRSFGCHILDAPNTTSSVTYKLQMLGTNNQPFCVGGSFDASDDNRSSVPTFITAMEIAG